MRRGILIAADCHCEWLIPWFFERLRAYTQLPLAIVDMGLTRGAKAFCEDRAELISINVGRIPPLAIQTQGWYKKPLALLHTPFDRTLWLDCDCEVIGPIDQLFALPGELYLTPDTENSRAKEIALGNIDPETELYNSGVVLFRTGIPLIEDWVGEVVGQQAAFFSDQHVLSQLISSGNYWVERLPDVYNWRMSQGLNICARIIHWAGSWGKTYIRKHAGLAHTFATLPRL